MNEENTGTHVIEWDINKAAIAEVAEEMKDIDATKDLDGAKKAKKKLTGMRTALTAAHKETKHEALEFGRKVDAKKNEYLALIKEIEDPITEALETIKNAEKLAEEQRVAKIMAEVERIQAYALDRHSLTLDELKERRTNLLEQQADKELLEEFFEDWELTYNEAELKLRLAIDREEQDQKEREERERVEAENRELREKIEKQEAEQAERDRITREEAEAKAEEQRKADQKAADERQAELDKQQDEIDRQREEQAAKELAEQEEADRVAAEEEAEKIRALQAPDIDKLKLYADAIDHLIGVKPVMGSTQGNAVLLNAVARLVETHNILNKNIEEMK